MTSGIRNAGPSDDTTLTKVFVGGLAWETPSDALNEHFEKYGDIVEAVVISDKITGRSKGYGFVTFNEPESAKKACEDPAPMINGRRANCNLASLGARRTKSPSIAPPHQNGTNLDVRPRSGGKTVTLPPSHVQWYYPPTPASHYINRQNHQTVVPYYGYAPATYVAAADVSYDHKLGYMGGAYMNGGNYGQLYPGQAMAGYPVHYYPQTGSMGFPTRSYIGPKASAPVILSKPTKATQTPGPTLDDMDNLRPPPLLVDDVPDNDIRLLADAVDGFFSTVPFFDPNGLRLGLRLGLRTWLGDGITDLVFVDLGELTRGEEPRGEETSWNEEFEMLCLLFRGDNVGSFMPFGLDSVSRRFDADGEETRPVEFSRSEEFEMLCLLFCGDDAGSFMLFGLDSVSRRFDIDGDRGDDVEGDRSSF
ncbi:hypothetical protein SSX86_017992 [Deinandra increscens subsp. villosa]|uniref:RRM domain-containing protein n=1 Tax=Deinandra increscens subsp. villosa TaxID=3103831 RepID=A0AAP0CW70_9ASTR